MARNKEKAQSMLYRFREAQAAELGINTGRKSGELRPRLASACKSLKECEKWRSDVLRDISRKVSKIQDFGLTDYEVRDLNDEINKCIREKGHWERQIVALGGANYRRGMGRMLDDSGKEVPGTRGYKYFGRAKDLPGVKELLNRTDEQEAELETYRSQKYKRFAQQPPAYFGDADEDDGELLAFETGAEEEAWRDGWSGLLEELGEELEGGLEAVPAIPRPTPTSLGKLREQTAAQQSEPAAPKGKGKRAAGRGGRSAAAKKTRGDGAVAPAEDGTAEQEDTEMADGEQADGAAAPRPAGDDARIQAVFSVLDPAELQFPHMPDRKETEQFLLQARKKALREQYIG